MTPVDESTSVDEQPSTLEQVLEHRLEILMCFVLAHLMGWTASATDYIGGMC